MNRRQQPSSRASSSLSTTTSGIARPLSSSKTMSKRAQRRVQQLVDLEESSKNEVHFKRYRVVPQPTYHHGTHGTNRAKKQRAQDTERYRGALNIERERRKDTNPNGSGGSDSSDDREGSGDDDGSDEKKKTKTAKQYLTETMTKADNAANEVEAVAAAHDRIDELISGYSDRVIQLNDLSRNAPTMDGIHEWNARGIRKGAGALRYHNRLTGSLTKTHRQHDNRTLKYGDTTKLHFHTSNTGYTSRAATLAHAIDHVAREARQTTDIDSMVRLRKELERPQNMMTGVVQGMLSDGQRKGKNRDTRHALKAEPHRQRRTHVRTLLRHGDLHGIESMGGGTANVFAYGHYGKLTVRKVHAPQGDLS